MLALDMPQSYSLAPADLLLCYIRCTLRADAGEGKAKMVDEKATTVYKRALSEEYRLKMKASRAILSEIIKRYPCMPFPLRKLLAPGNCSKFGLVECVNHGLLQARAPSPSNWWPPGHMAAAGRPQKLPYSPTHSSLRSPALCAARVIVDACGAVVPSAVGAGWRDRGAHQGHCALDDQRFRPHHVDAAAGLQIREEREGTLCAFFAWCTCSCNPAACVSAHVTLHVLTESMGRSVVSDFVAAEHAVLTMLEPQQSSAERQVWSKLLITSVLQP
jgi:hypothetical protein